MRLHTGLHVQTVAAGPDEAMSVEPSAQCAKLFPDACPSIRESIECPSDTERRGASYCLVLAAWRIDWLTDWFSDKPNDGGLKTKRGCHSAHEQQAARFRVDTRSRPLTAGEPSRRCRQSRLQAWVCQDFARSDAVGNCWKSRLVCQRAALLAAGRVFCGFDRATSKGDGKEDGEICSLVAAARLKGPAHVDCPARSSC